MCYNDIYVLNNEHHWEVLCDHFKREGTLIIFATLILKFETIVFVVWNCLLDETIVNLINILIVELEVQSQSLDSM